MHSSEKLPQKTVWQKMQQFRQKYPSDTTSPVEKVQSTIHSFIQAIQKHQSISI